MISYIVTHSLACAIYFPPQIGPNSLLWRQIFLWLPRGQSLSGMIWMSFHTDEHTKTLWSNLKKPLGDQFKTNTSGSSVLRYTNIPRADLADLHRCGLLCVAPEGSEGALPRSGHLVGSCHLPHRWRWDAWSSESFPAFSWSCAPVKTHSKVNPHKDTGMNGSMWMLYISTKAAWHCLPFPHHQAAEGPPFQKVGPELQWARRCPNRSRHNLP